MKFFSENRLKLAMKINLNTKKLLMMIYLKMNNILNLLHINKLRIIIGLLCSYRKYYLKNKNNFQD